MKKLFVIFFAALLAMTLVSCGVPEAAAVEEEKGEILSAYYGINRQDGLIGQVTAGTGADTLLTRILAPGTVTLPDGVKTGASMIAASGDAQLDRLTLVVQADCNCDGQFSVSDMLMVKSRLLNQQNFTAAQAQAADVSGDGKVTITDFLRMKSAILGLSRFSPQQVSGAALHNSLLMTVGQTCSFGPVSDNTEPTTNPVSIEGSAVTWENGIVTAVKLGTARLKWGSDTLMVTVCSEPLKIDLPDETLILDPGTTSPLPPVVNHPLTSHIQYTCSDGNVARIDSSGMVTALNDGTATITATAPNGASDTQSLRVIQMITSISCEETYIKLKPGTSKTLSVTITPATSPEKLIWTSSDPSIATVDANGVITGKAYGTVTIACISEYGKVYATCKVKVCDLIQVALTFDDGPSASYTNKVLDMLQEYDAKATFFLVGNRISKCKAEVKRMADEGHEIGHHTWSHTFFGEMTADQIKNDFQKVQNAVKNASGASITVYRAPGGSITKNALNNIPVPHIMWSVDTRDWATRNTEKVKNAILNGLKDGAIILLHDIHGTTYTGTLAAMEYIADHDLDVEFVTVTELLSRDGTPPKAGSTYYKG